MQAIILGAILIGPLLFWLIPQAKEDWGKAQSEARNKQVEQHDPQKAQETVIALAVTAAIVVLLFVTS